MAGSGGSFQGAWARLSLWARSHAPEPLKRIGRGLRLLLTSAPPSAPEIPQELLDGARLLSSRDRLLDVLPKGGRVAEVGTQRGHYARRILAVARPAELHLIDLDFTQLEADVRAGQGVTLHEAMSHDALASFADGGFDWIYIDADHAYASVARDAAAAAPKLKPGGYLVFNDFARIVRQGLGVFGVHQAVCEFVIRERWPVAYLCLNGEALYDIALRKPGGG